MQLNKQRRKLTRDLLVDIGTPNNSQLIPRWQMGKTQEAIAEQLRSRCRNPKDAMYQAGLVK